MAGKFCWQQGFTVKSGTRAERGWAGAGRAGRDETAWGSVGQGRAGLMCSMQSMTDGTRASLLVMFVYVFDGAIQGDG